MTSGNFWLHLLAMLKIQTRQGEENEAEIRGDKFWQICLGEEPVQCSMVLCSDQQETVAKLID